MDRLTDNYIRGAAVTEYLIYKYAVLNRDSSQLYFLI